MNGIIQQQLQRLNHLFGRQIDHRVLLLGLDCSGKTALLYRLKLHEVVTTIPTIGFNIETIVHKSHTYDMWDVGGCDKIRPLWRHYFANTSLAVFCISSIDRERFDAAVEELNRLQRAAELRDVPFIILVTCQDAPCENRVTVEELERRLQGEHRFDCILPVSAYTGEGLDVLLDSLYTTTSGKKQEIQEEKRKQNQEEKTEDGMLPKKFEQWLSRKDCSDDEFLSQLRNFTLDSWDHYTHLRIAFVLLNRHGRREGMRLIFADIQNFIENSLITKRSRGTTFHETMTYFWAHMIHYAIEACKFGKKNLADAKPSTDFKQFLLLNPQLANGGLFLHYYSKELMLKTAESRLQVMLPDKRPLPSILGSAETKVLLDEKPQLSGPMQDSTFLQLVLNSKAPSMGHEARIRTIWICLHQSADLRSGRMNAFAALQVLDGDAYHETQAYFWIQMVTHAQAKTKNVEKTFHDFIGNPAAQFLRNPDRIDKYYSASILMKGARAMVLPDKKTLPQFV